MTFDEFAQTRLPALLAFATVLTGQRATAEDITQEVLIRAHGRWDQIAPLDRPELYVRKMVLNEFLSWRRRSWRTVPDANPMRADDLTADHAASYNEHAAMLAQIAKPRPLSAPTPRAPSRPCASNSAPACPSSQHQCQGKSDAHRG